MSEAEVVPGPRAKKMREALGKMIDTMLKSCTADAVADCFPKEISRTQLNGAMKEINSFLRESTLEEFDNIAAEHRLIERLNDMDALVTAHSTGSGAAKTGGKSSWDSLDAGERVAAATLASRRAMIALVSEKLKNITKSNEAMATQITGIMTGMEKTMKRHADASNVLLKAAEASEKVRFQWTLVRWANVHFAVAGGGRNVGHHSGGGAFASDLGGQFAGQVQGAAGSFRGGHPHNNGGRGARRPAAQAPQVAMLLILICNYLSILFYCSIRAAIPAKLPTFYIPLCIIEIVELVVVHQ